MNIKVFDTPEDGSRYVARQIKKIVDAENSENKQAVLGLATGSTPIRMYGELVKLHQAGELSFKNVITFNLDEYHPMPRESKHSYYYFMHHHLFNEVDIPEENVHIPGGEVDKAAVAAYCDEYEKQITAAGGIDVQILGIGGNGHIGFNEPGSEPESKTRYITLDVRTRTDAASAFNGIENVPTHAVSMGMQTILAAKAIILMAWGKGKAEIVRDCFTGNVTTKRPASFLQNHKNVQIVLDREAAQLLGSH